MKLAGLSDARVLSGLHRACFVGAEVWDTRAMTEILKMPGAFGLIASREGEAVAFLLARMAADEAEIISLGADASQRRQGLARCLVQFMVQKVSLLQGRRVFLEVAEANRPARALYTSEGFHEVGRRPNYYQGKTGEEATAIVMTYSIDRMLY